MESRKIETLCIHGGQTHEPVTGAVMPPVFQTSTYAQEWPAKHTGYEYARTQNPTREALERCVATLEGGTDGIAFGSGLAATTALIQTLRGSARVVCGDDVYGGTFRLFTKIFAKTGMEFSFVDFAAVPLPVAIPAGTDLVWLETPSNPLLKVFDIAAVARRCREIGAKLAVDNTFATPIFQRPLSLGADVVVHSTTKYLNGHSDVVGGIAVTADPELASALRFTQNAAGGVPGPWDTWLTLRGIKTLALRMERHAENAAEIVDWLGRNKQVEKVLYPLLPGHAGHDVALRQMSGFGGMVSFVLAGSLHRAEKFCASTELFTCAESLGGVESLIELPATMTHASVPAELRRARGLADGLIRLSIGVESASDLIADLERALARSAEAP